MVCNFDKFVLPPFNYKYAFDGFIKGFAEFDDVDKEKVDILTEKTNHIITASDELFKMLTTLNNTDSLKMDNNIAKDERLKLMEVYRLVQGDLKKLSPWDDVVYGHDLIINNIKAIKDASIKLQDNDLKAAVDALWEVDLFKLAYQFDSKTYDWIMHCQDNKRTDLYWGTGKIQEYIRFDSLIKAIRKNNVLEAAEELKNLLIFEKQLLQEMIDQEVVVLSKIESLIAEIKLSRFL